MVTEKGSFLVRPGLALQLNEGQKKQIHPPLSQRRGASCLWPKASVGLSPYPEQNRKESSTGPSHHSSRPSKESLPAACPLFHTHVLRVAQFLCETKPEIAESSFGHLASSSHFLVLGSKLSRGTYSLRSRFGFIYVILSLVFFKNIGHLWTAWSSSPGPLCFFRAGFFSPGCPTYTRLALFSPWWARGGGAVSPPLSLLWQPFLRPPGWDGIEIRTSHRRTHLYS